MPTKRARKHNARPLPKGLTQEMLPKYVVYYHECYNKERQLFREFFKIEKQHWSLLKTFLVYLHIMPENDLINVSINTKVMGELLRI